MSQERRHTIGELAELTGVSRRTIHFYVQRGLLPRPMGAGRGHYYTGEHLGRLSAIKGLQADGLPLGRIARRLSGADGAPHDTESPPDGGPPPSLWRRVVVADGVELQVESGTRRLTPAKLDRLRRAVREILGETPAQDHPRDEGDDK